MFQRLFYILLCLPNIALAFNWQWFQNSEQQAANAFEQKQYSDAAKLFTDPYQRGVALYKEGQYAEAIEAFGNVTHPQAKLKAQYNLGNAYFQEGEYEQAIKAYEQVLAAQPDHDDAQHNLALARQQSQQESEDNSSQQGDSQENQDKGEDSQENQDKGEDSQENQDKGENSESQQNQAAENEQGNDSEESEHQQGEQDQAQENAEQAAEQAQGEMESVSEEEGQHAQEAQEAQQENGENQEAGNAALSEAELPSESDMMADALLNRIADNPQQLLRGQFYLDARRAKATPPEKPW